MYCDVKEVARSHYQRDHDPASGLSSPALLQMYSPYMRMAMLCCNAVFCSSGRRPPRALRARRADAIQVLHNFISSSCALTYHYFCILQLVLTCCPVLERNHVSVSCRPISVGTVLHRCCNARRDNQMIMHSCLFRGSVCTCTCFTSSPASLFLIHCRLEPAA